MFLRSEDTEVEAGTNFFSQIYVRIYIHINIFIFGVKD